MANRQYTTSLADRRRAVEMWRVDGMSYREIAVSLGVPPSAARLWVRGSDVHRRWRALLAAGNEYVVRDWKRRLGLGKG